MTPSRRGFVAGAGLLGLASAEPLGAASGKPIDRASPANLQTILDRYAALGDKAAGGVADNASGAWLEQELRGFGYTCRRQQFDVPYFDATQATLAIDGARVSVIPQGLVVPTGPRGLTAPLHRAGTAGDPAGKIAMVVLPYKRWAALADPQVATPLADALASGAAGVVLVTTGPTGEAIALNVSARRTAATRSVAVLAPKDAVPFLAAAARNGTATLTLDGRGGGGGDQRQAYNVIGRLDRGADRTLVVVTPRSGWFGCAAERGSGLAIWLWLARRLARSRYAVNIELVATSGHEYEYLGGAHYLEEAAPKPAATRLRVHIGASAAARDWHEHGQRLLPLPSSDSQRVLTASQDLLEPTRAAFAGLVGLEATYLADKVMAGGELVDVLAAGYKSLIGLYGGHRYFHTRGDDLRCVSGSLVAPVADAFRAAIAGALD